MAMAMAMTANECSLPAASLRYESYHDARGGPAPPETAIAHLSICRPALRPASRGAAGAPIMQTAYLVRVLRWPRVAFVALSIFSHASGFDLPGAMSVAPNGAVGAGKPYGRGSAVANKCDPEWQRRHVISSLLAPLTPLVWANAAFADDSPPRAPDYPVECANGGIVSESSVPGAYTQTCMDLDERTFELKSTGDTVALYQGANAAGGIAGRTGVTVWNSGILLTRLLDKLNQSNPSIFKNKYILELGSGASLATIAVTKFGASSAVATDANPEVLALAQRNIERNNVTHVAKTAALQWGLLDAIEYEGKAGKHELCTANPLRFGSLSLLLF
ncbi:hypothetical protein ACHAWF_013202 [Thalassiosira exigua]